MKYIKKFEGNEELKYKIGDCVVTNYAINAFDSDFFEIIGYTKIKAIPYIVKSLTYNMFDPITFNDKDIKRKMTKKEIEKVKFENIVKTYNL